jgi:hypothetical protein
VQPDRIREIEGYWNNDGNTAVSFSGYGGAYAPEQKQGTVNGSTASMADTYWRNTFKASLVVPTGPDNAPANAAVRFWRRTA